MTTLTNVSEPGPIPPVEPDLTPAEVVKRAEAIAPTLIARQAETEERTFYAADTHQQFVDAGFYRILIPKRYGGYELGADTFIRVAVALARGCPSTAWMYVFGAAHTIPVATLFGEQAQDDFFGGGEFICPATVGIGPGQTAQRVDGGWVINGTWSYASGSPYATHFLGHALVPQPEGPPVPLLFVVPRAAWERLDDWGDQLGLRGSGSHSIKVTDAFVPDHHTLPTHLSMTAVTDESPGHLLHPHPEYGGGPLSFMLLDIGALAVGMAKGALDAYEELLGSRFTIFPPFGPRIEDVDYQSHYGEATGLIASAEATLLSAVRRWQDLCAVGPSAFSREEEIRIAMLSREAARLSWRAVESHLFPTAGSSSIRRGERIERIWRDLSTLHSHAGYAIYLNALANRELTRTHFNLPPM